MHSKTRWVTQTALMTALLIVLQAVTKPAGQFVTGSCVNFVLATATLLCGLSSGLTVALLSPFFAFFLGIGPAFLPVTPGISVGNGVLVLLLYALLGRREGVPGVPLCLGAVILAAAAKFLSLWLVIVKLLLPLMGLPEKQMAVLSASFTWPQLITALIGGVVAVAVWPLLARAVNNRARPA